MAKKTGKIKISPSKSLTKVKPALGRKRDHTLDPLILETTINVLADIGFDKMTMDSVAAKAKTAKASMYRRWPSKVELVSDALIWMGKNSVEIEEVLPDTGSLKNDLLSVIKPHSIERSERKLRVFARLGSFFTEHKKIAEETTAEIFKPWTTVNLALMKRAIARGELSSTANIEMACEIITSMTSHRVVMLGKHLDKDYYSSLLDNILLPALKNC